MTYTKEESIFTKIIKGQISCDKIYENKDTLAFLDINPINEGHTLVITKKEYKDFLDIPETELENLSKTVQKVAKAVKKATHADGINISTNIGEAAGQVVFHVHVHIIPRFENDGLKSWKRNSNARTNKDIAQNISKYL